MEPRKEEAGIGGYKRGRGREAASESEKESAKTGSVNRGERARRTTDSAAGDGGLIGRREPASYPGFSALSRARRIAGAGRVYPEHPGEGETLVVSQPAGCLR